tara:strand:- start:5537 stop:6178 length:642 start_codon:yes stop_codon:yes gene_type:complete
MKARFSWAAGTVILSDQRGAFERWQLPSFEPPPEPEPPVDAAQELEIARAQGFEQGQAAGREAGLAEARQVVAQVERLLDGMARPYAHLDQVVTRELVQTVMRVAATIVRRELSVDSSLIERTVTEAVATLASVDADIEISLNPADVAVVRELAPQLLDGNRWKLVEDDELLAGGCRLKTPVSYVDASIEKQIEALSNTLMEACESSPESGEP